eukprot:COSAG02_NODE_16715_length_1061_cov_4.821206_1_plen_80_part_00
MFEAKSQQSGTLINADNKTFWLTVSGKSWITVLIVNNGCCGALALQQPHRGVASHNLTEVSRAPENSSRSSGRVTTNGR